MSQLDRDTLAAAGLWDREYETIYREFGIQSQSRESMYTSVHYILQANQKTKITAELQVRTLMEEVWGEVSHRVDYPIPGSRSCKDQLKVLARLTSGSTRLVDSIFKTHDEGLHMAQERHATPGRRRTGARRT